MAINFDELPDLDAPKQGGVVSFDDLPDLDAAPKPALSFNDLPDLDAAPPKPKFVTPANTSIYQGKGEGVSPEVAKFMAGKDVERANVAAQQQAQATAADEAKRKADVAAYRKARTGRNFTNEYGGIEGLETKFEQLDDATLYPEMERERREGTFRLQEDEIAAQQKRSLAMTALEQGPVLASTVGGEVPADTDAAMALLRQTPTDSPLRRDIEESSRLRRGANPVVQPSEMEISRPVAEEYGLALVRGAANVGFAPMEAASRLVAGATAPAGGQAEAVRGVSAPMREFEQSIRPSDDLSGLYGFSVKATEAIPQLAAQIAVSLGGAGAIGFATTAMAPTMASTYNSTYDTIIANGGDHDTASLWAIGTGAAVGTMSYLLNKAEFNVLAGSKAAQAVAKQHIAARIVSRWMAGASAEAVQEGSEQASQEVAEAVMRAANNIEGIPFEQAMAQILESMALGAAIGGPVGGFASTEAMQEQEARQQRAAYLRQLKQQAQQQGNPIAAQTLEAQARREEQASLAAVQQAEDAMVQQKVAAYQQTQQQAAGIFAALDQAVEFSKQIEQTQLQARTEQANARTQEAKTQQAEAKAAIAEQKAEEQTAKAMGVEVEPPTQENTPLSPLPQGDANQGAVSNTQPDALMVNASDQETAPTIEPEAIGVQSSEPLKEASLETQPSPRQQPSVGLDRPSPRIPDAAATTPVVGGGVVKDSKPAFLAPDAIVGESSKAPWEMTADEYDATQRLRFVEQNVENAGNDLIKAGKKVRDPGDSPMVIVTKRQLANAAKKHGVSLSDLANQNDAAWQIEKIPESDGYIVSKRRTSKWTRKNDVARALEAGKPVPDSVLADYPDLAAKYKKSQPTAPTQEVIPSSPEISVVGDESVPPTPPNKVVEGKTSKAKQEPVKADVELKEGETTPAVVGAKIEVFNSFGDKWEPATITRIAKNGTRLYSLDDGSGFGELNPDSKIARTANATPISPLGETTPKSETPTAKPLKSVEMVLNLGRKMIKVFKNPTQEDRYELSQRFKKQYPQAPVGEPKTRQTVDRDGNVYVWMAGDGIHVEVEAALKDKGIEANQNGYFEPKKKSPYQDDIDKLIPILERQVNQETSASRKMSIANGIMDGEAPAVQEALAAHLWKIAEDAAALGASGKYSSLSTKSAIEKARPTQTPKSETVVGAKTEGQPSTISKQEVSVGDVVSIVGRESKGQSTILKVLDSGKVVVKYADGKKSEPLDKSMVKKVGDAPKGILEKLDAMLDKQVEKIKKRKQDDKDKGISRFSSGVNADDVALLTIYAIKAGIRLGEAIRRGGARVRKAFDKMFNESMAALRSAGVKESDVLALEAKRNVVYNTARKIRPAIVDANGLVDLAKVQDAINNNAAFRKAVREGIKKGGDEAREEAVIKIAKIRRELKDKAVVSRNMKRWTAEIILRLVRKDVQLRKAWLGTLANIDTPSAMNGFLDRVSEYVDSFRAKRDIKNLLKVVGGKEKKPRVKKPDTQDIIEEMVGVTEPKEPLSKKGIKPTDMSSTYVNGAKLSPREAVTDLYNALRKTDTISGTSKFADFLEQEMDGGRSNFITPEKVLAIRALEGKPIKGLTSEEARGLSFALQHARHLDSQFTSGKQQEKYQELEGRIERSMEALNRQHPESLGSDPVKAKMDGQPDRSSLKQFAVDLQFDDLVSSKFVMGEEGEVKYKDDVEAEDKMLTIQQEWEAITTAVNKDHGVNLMKHADLFHDIIENIGGHGFTAANLIKLALYTKSEATRTKLYSHGFVLRENAGQPSKNYVPDPEVVDFILSKQGEPYDYIRDFAERAYQWMNTRGKELLNLTSQDLDGVDIAPLMDYVMMSVDFSQSEGGKAKDIDDLNNIDPFKSVEGMGILKARRGSGLPLLIDNGILAMERHVKQVSSYHSFARPIREFLAIINNPEMKAMIIDRVGQSWIDSQVRRYEAATGMIKMEPGWWSRFFRSLRTAATTFALGFNPSSAAIQVTLAQTIAGGGDLNAKDAAKMLAPLSKESSPFPMDRPFLEALLSNPHFRHRYKQSLFVMSGSYAFEERVPKTRMQAAFKAFQEFSFKFLQDMDKGVMIRLLKVNYESSDNTGTDHGSKMAWALKRTEMLARKWNAPASMLDSSNASIKARTSALYIPLSYMRGQVGKMFNSVYEPYIRGDKKMVAQRIANVVATSISTALIRTTVKVSFAAAVAKFFGMMLGASMEDEEENVFVKNTARSIARDLGELVSPIGGDLVAALIAKMEGKSGAGTLDMLKNPGYETLGKIFSAGNALVDDLVQAYNANPQDDRFADINQSALKSLEAVALYLGIPSGWFFTQAKRGTKLDIPYSAPYRDLYIQRSRLAEKERENKKAIEIAKAKGEKINRFAKITPQENALLDNLNDYWSRINALKKRMEAATTEKAKKSYEESIAKTAEAANKRIAQLKQKP